MKKIILSLSLLFSAYLIQAQSITWHTDLKVASEIAMRENKPLMLFFTGSDWCGWCIRLQNEVFRKPEFEAWANQNVISVELDFPRNKPQEENLKAQNQQLGQMLGVQGYPTCWFVTPTIGANNQISVNPLGSQGYVAGGPSAWIQGANVFLPKKEPISLPTVQKPIAAKSKKKRKTRSR
jgi:thiol-disulfide isomerase/thioredoxin